MLIVVLLVTVVYTVSIVTLLFFQMLCLTVLVLGALLSSFLEEALYKC